MRFVIIFHVLLLVEISFTTRNKTELNGSTHILSRKRRYLTFPEGSSLQLVYCMTQPSLGMGKIFTVGNIVALAWELPNDPMAFLLDKKKKPEEKQPEHAHEPPDEPKFPVFYDDGSSYSSPQLIPDPVFDRKDSHLRPMYTYRPEESKYYNFDQYNRNTGVYRNYKSEDRFHPSYQHHFVDPEYRHVYRRTRRDVYGKLMKLLNALSRDGRACILKLICEVSQVAKRKGTFMEEIVKVVFRIKTHDTMTDEDEYDTAYNANHNCNERYKTCTESFFFMERAVIIDQDIISEEEVAPPEISGFKSVWKISILYIFTYLIVLILLLFK